MDLETVIEMNKGLIYDCSNKFYNVDKDDLYQAGVLGLIKAYKNYHFDGKTKFSTYAYKYIYGEMYLLVSNQNVKVNKDILKLAKLIQKTKYMLAQKINKIPTDAEISKFLNIPIEKINEAILSVNEVLSLDNGYDVAKDNEDYDNKVMISQGLKYLSSEEKQVILDRYYNDLTQDEVAKKLAISQVTVSRYEKRSLNKLYDYMNV